MAAGWSLKPSWLEYRSATPRSGLYSRPEDQTSRNWSWEEARTLWHNAHSSNIRRFTYTVFAFTIRGTNIICSLFIVYLFTSFVSVFPKYSPQNKNKINKQQLGSRLALLLLEKYQNLFLPNWSMVGGCFIVRPSSGTIVLHFTSAFLNGISWTGKKGSCCLFCPRIYHLDNLWQSFQGGSALHNASPPRSMLLTQAS